MSASDYAAGIAETLPEESLYVDPSIEADIDVPVLESAAREAESLDYDVSIIAVPEERADDDLLTLVDALRSDSGEENGVYFLVTPESATYTRVELPSEEAGIVYDQFSVARSRDFSSLAPETEVLRTVELLQNPEPAPPQQAQPWGQPRMGEDFEPGGLSGNGLLGIIVVVGFLGAGLVAGIVAMRNRRRARADYVLPAAMVKRAKNLQRDAMREELSKSSLTVADDLAGMDTSNMPERDALRVEKGLDAYRLASDIIDDASASAVDLAGALVLLRLAGHEHAALTRRKTRKKADDESLCAMNPLHGEALAHRVSPVPGQVSVSLPVCRTCASSLTAGREPDWLYDGNRPYPEGETVWARTLFGAVGPDLVSQIQRQRR